MELKTARFTVLLDPAKKRAFEQLCAEEDQTPSQVVRRLQADHLQMEETWSRVRTVLQRLVDEGEHLPPTWAEETRELFQHFVSLYEHHIPDEERLVFPAGERAIRAEQLALMAQDMMQRRGVSLG